MLRPFDRLLLVFAVAFFAVLNACGGGDPPRVDYSCTLEEDCVVKNVGNCCGANNVCVNVNFEPDPDAVLDACDDRAVSCVEMPPVRGCQCVESACVTRYGN